MMQNHTADLARGFLQLIENGTLEENANQHQPCHRSSEASSLMTGFACSAANLKDNKYSSLQKAFNKILVFHPSYNKHLSVCTNSVSICVLRSCNCLDIVTVHEASEGKMFQTSITTQEAV